VFVSLGNCNELLSADPEADRLPDGTHSVKGLGKVAPDPLLNKNSSDGYVEPCGNYIERGVVNKEGDTLNYNAYVVYHPNQVQIKFIVKVKFDFH